jgi:hypothetical protein
MLRAVNRITSSDRALCAQWLTRRERQHAKQAERIVKTPRRA